MSVIPSDMVHGEHLAKPLVQKQPLLAATYSVDLLIAKQQANIDRIEFTDQLGIPVVKLITDEGVKWFNGQTGEPLAALNEAQIADLAREMYQGNGAIAAITLLQQLPQEMGSAKVPMWQVVFDDNVATTLYITTQEGRLFKVRSDIWRFYDFFWMLHIMDYDERSDSHNPLLVAFSIFALLFAVSGLILLFQVFKKRDFLGRSKRRNKTLNKA